MNHRGTLPTAAQALKFVRRSETASRRRIGRYAKAALA